MTKKPSPFGKLLKAKRETAGISARALARAVRNTSVSRVEAGDRSCVDERTWTPLAQCLNVPEYLVVLAALASTPLTVDLRRAPPEQALVAAMLARRVRAGRVSPDTLEAIFQLLKRDRDQEACVVVRKKDQES